MLAKILKFPVLKRVIPSILIRTLRLLKKNRGYFKINNILDVGYVFSYDRDLKYSNLDSLNVDLTVNILSQIFSKEFL